MKHSDKKKIRTSLHNLLKNDQEVWVVNMTGTPQFRSKHKNAGPISIMTGIPGNSDRIIVPPGSDPICLTDMMDLESLRTCRDLFKSLDSGGLRLLPPEEAEAYYEKHEARLEVMQKKMDKYLALEKEKEVPQHLQEQNFAGKQVREELNPRVSDLCLKAKHKRYDEQDILEQFLEIGGSFGEPEFQYIASNGGYPAVKNWAKDMLKELLKAKEKENDPIENA